MSNANTPVHQPLGLSGLKVPQLWLGTMMFGDQTSEADSRNIIDATREAGLNALDTADVYAKGESERIVGRAIAADRDRWIVATRSARSRTTGACRAAGCCRP
jgi:aryl-alcohol dehydrogenase-like predicted oxidoreductase